MPHLRKALFCVALKQKGSGSSEQHANDTTTNHIDITPSHFFKTTNTLSKFKTSLLSHSFLCEIFTLLRDGALVCCVDTKKLRKL